MVATLPAPPPPPLLPPPLLAVYINAEPLLPPPFPSDPCTQQRSKSQPQRPSPLPDLYPTTDGRRLCTEVPAPECLYTDISRDPPALPLQPDIPA